MERREFLKKVGCGVCLLGVAGVAIPGLFTPSQASSRTYPGVINDQDQILVPLDQISGVDLLIVSVRQWSANIAVHAKADGSYIALLLLCTHLENNLQITSRGYTCNVHGSAYDQNGNVTIGPAEEPLTQFPVSVANGQLVLNVKDGAP